MSRDRGTVQSDTEDLASRPEDTEQLNNMLVIIITVVIRNTRLPTESLINTSVSTLREPLKT